MHAKYKNVILNKQTKKIVKMRCFQLPAAKSHAPMNLKTPVFVPVWLDTITLSPSLRAPPPPVLEARLSVDPAGDGVFDLFNFRVDEDGDMEARALEATVVLEATDGVSGSTWATVF